MGYVLIIGAKSDIAKAVARVYTANGYDLILAARNSKELQSFAKDLNIRSSRKVSLVDIDVLDFASHEEFYKGLVERPVGVVVAAGYLGDQEKAQSDFEESQKIVDTNYTGIVSLLNIIANDFEKHESGFIVGISSVAGDRGRKSNYVYGSSKAALTAYLSGLRNRLFDSGVHVLTVKPGFVETKMTEKMDLPERLTAKPDEVAKAIFHAQRTGKNVVYTKGMWKWIMLTIKNIPEWKFKKMSI